MTSNNIRATLRNLYINGVIALMIVAYAMLQEFLAVTIMTPKLENIVFWAAVAALIAWALFLGHCCGELVLELRRSNYHYMWSFLPFFLPVIFYAVQGGIANWLAEHIFI